MEFDVFISYSTKDQQIADKVCKYLEERGLRCFISSRDIPKGVEWPSALAAALKASRLFLAIFSNNYNLSMQVNKELTIASKRHVPLLTFKITDDDFEGTKDYFLSEVNFIIGYPDAEQALKPLYEDISALMKTLSPVGKETAQSELSFTYQEDSERIVKDLLSQKPKSPDKRLELAEKLAKYKEWQTAFYWYRKAAEKDVPEAVFHLADCYAKGLGTKADLRKAIDLYEKAYGLGYLPAANRLGHVYYDGEGVEPDYVKSLEWFEKANSEDCAETFKDLADYYSEGKACPPDEAKEFTYRKKYYEYHFYNALENENVDSMFIVGTLCEEGKGVDQNDAYALSWYARAARSGSSKAKYRLGEIYEKGSSVTKDPEKAFKYIEDASTYSDRAMIKLGDYYRLGFGTAENPTKAFQCYLLAAATSSAEAWYKVGYCYEMGLGTSKKYTKAEEFYLRAANQGIVAARSRLGKLQYNKLGKKDEGLANLESAASQDDYAALNALGVIYWKSEDVDELKKAIDYFRKAAEVSPKEGEPLTRIGRIYAREGPLQDETKAFESYKEAAERGDKAAMRSLANCYVNGKGVDQDDFLAFAWVTKAVKAGNKVALNLLGEFYRFGIGTKKDPQKAIEYYRLSDEAYPHSIGALNLGEMYFYGEGIPVDYEEATRWFQKVCESENPKPQAYVFIGRMYEMGVYGEKNISQAISWYQKGVQLGSPFADYYLGACYAHDDILPDPEKAVACYAKASEVGLMEAKLELAKCCLEGLGTEKDEPKAFALFEEIAQRWLEIRQAIGSYVRLAREQKGSTATNDRQSELKKPLYAEAMYHLGVCYVQGVGTEVNPTEGRRWIAIASKLGNREAADYKLG